MDLILHIGCEKTGTTSLQTFLVNNRARLSTLGYCVPESLGLGNQVKLAAAAIHGDKWDQLLRVYNGINSAESLATFRKTLKAKLQGEISGSSTVIISSEHLSSTLLQDSEIEWLAEFLAPLFRQIKVVVYLRRQDLFHASHYSTAVKMGVFGPLSYPKDENIAKRYDYELLLRRWARVFDTIDVRRFDAKHLVGGDIVHDFLAAAGIAAQPDFEFPHSENTSLEVDQIDFLSAVNRLLPLMKDGALNPERKFLERHIETVPPSGGKIFMRPEDAQRLMQTLEASNRWVAETYLSETMPEGDPLFGALSLRESGPQGALPVEAMVQTALSLMRARERRPNVKDGALICEMFAAWWAETNRKAAK